ncbi:MAG: helix-turn-helix domain-containing protein, partial [Bacteroidales bacterium]|nr:helix-turn-helix domain-containing protein [Bacteroidales bacterium]
MYKQLTSEQRYVISALLKRKTSPKEIAEEIGCHISTVYRE